MRNNCLNHFDISFIFKLFHREIVFWRSAKKPRYITYATVYIYEQTNSLITKEIGNPKIFENGNFSTKFVLDGFLQPKGLENHFEMYLNMLVYITPMWLWKQYMNNCYFQNNLPG